MSKLREWDSTLGAILWVPSLQEEQSLERPAKIARGPNMSYVSEYEDDDDDDEVRRQAQH